MAKALFHKSQRVFIKPVGTWAIVEKVIPHWVKDVEEPLRVTYDVGLGREFSATELVSEEVMHGRSKSRMEDDPTAEIAGRKAMMFPATPSRAHSRSS